MKNLYIDTANLEEIEEAHHMGIIKGCTTNPSLVAHEPKQDYKLLTTNLVRFCSDNDLSISVEVFETEPEEVIKQAMRLYNNFSFFGKPSLIHIKIPIGIEEIKIIKQLSKREININCTACFTEMQLQNAATAGAKYVSLFYNRARDMKIDVNKVLQRTSQFIKENNLKTKIIAGSIRTPQDVSDAWDSGADIVTCSLKIIKEMLQHEGTTKSINGFVKDFSEWLK